MEDYLNISEAAEELGVHPETLRRWDKSGKLRSVRVAGSTHRKYPAALIAKIKTKKTPSATESPILRPKTVVTDMLFDPRSFIDNSAAFTRLLWSLAVHFKNYSDAEIIDGTNDLGVDITAYERGIHNKKEKLIYIQSKFVIAINYSQLEAEAKKIADNVKSGSLEKPNVYIIGCSVNIGAQSRRKLKDYLAKKLPGVRVGFWCLREIDQMIKADKITYEKFIQRPMDIKTSSMPTEPALNQNADIAGQHEPVYRGYVSDFENIKNEIDKKIKRTSQLIEQGQVSQANEALLKLQGTMEIGAISGEQKAKILNNLAIVNIIGATTESLEEAVKLLGQALSFDPDMEKATTNLVFAYNLLKKYGDARKILGTLDQAINSKDPRRVALYFDLSARKSSSEVAIKEYEEILKSDRDLSFLQEESVRRQIAYLLLDLKRYKEAYELVDKNLDENPEDIFSMYLKAVIKLAEASRTAKIFRLTLTPGFEKPQAVKEASDLFKDAYELAKNDESAKPIMAELIYNLQLCSMVLSRFYNLHIKLPDDINLSDLDGESGIKLQAFIDKKDYQNAYKCYESLSKLPGVPMDQLERVAEIFLYNGSPEYFMKVQQDIEDRVSEKDLGSQHWLNKSIAEVLLEDKPGAISAAAKAVKLASNEPKENYKIAMSHQGALLLRYPKEGDSILKTMLKYDEEFPEDKSLTKLNFDQDKEVIIKSITDRRSWYENVRDTYLNNAVSNYSLSKMLNLSFLEVWKQRGVDLPMYYLDPGTEFVDRMIDILDDSEFLIFDYQSLLTLSKTKLLGLVSRLNKKICIHHDTFNQIQEELVRHEDQDLRRVWEFIRTNTDISFVFSVEVTDVNLKKIKEHLPDWLIESMQISFNGDATLVTDDLRLLKLVNLTGKAVNSFALIQNFKNQDYIDGKRFSQVKYELADCCYSFLPFDSEDLYEAVWLSDYKLNKPVAFYIHELHLAGSDPVSFTKVFVGFLVKLWNSGALPEDKIEWLLILNQELGAYIEDLEKHIRAGQVEIDINELVTTFLHMWLVPIQLGKPGELKILLQKTDKALSAPHFDTTREELIKQMKRAIKVKNSEADQG